MLNINKLSARVSYLKGEYIIVLARVKELYIFSFKNKKFIIVVKTIIADKRKPLPPFVIAFKKQIIDNWINKKLISKERITITLISYINNKIAL